jgi:hypothetical protein
MSLHFNIEPVWNMERYRALDYKLDHHKDTDLTQRYLDAGHSAEAMTLYNYFEPNPMPPSIEYICSYFTELKNVSVAVNLFKPGTYLPVHVDLYKAYKKHHNLTNEIIYRYVIMLEDGVDGQIISVGDDIYTKWEAGDVFGWKDCDKHTFYNLSTEDRYAVQLTGT